MRRRNGEVVVDTYPERIRRLLATGQTLTRHQLQELTGSNDLSGALLGLVRRREIEVVEGYGPNRGRGYRKYVDPWARIVLDLEKGKP